MGTVTKDNRVHAILKLISTGEKYDWEPEHLAREMSKWYKKYTIYEVSHLCKVLEAEEIIHELSSGTWVLSGAHQLKRAREVYFSNKYKEPTGFWTTTNTIITALASIATVFGVVFGILAYGRQNTIEKQETELQVIRRQFEKVSTERDSLNRIIKRQQESASSVE